MIAGRTGARAGGWGRQRMDERGSDTTSPSPMIHARTPHTCMCTLIPKGTGIQVPVTWALAAVLPFNTLLTERPGESLRRAWFQAAP